MYNTIQNQNVACRQRGDDDGGDVQRIEYHQRGDDDGGDVQ